MKIQPNTAYQFTPLTTSGGLQQANAANKTVTTQAPTGGGQTQKFAPSTASPPPHNPPTSSGAAVTVHTAPMNFGNSAGNGGGGYAASVKGG